MRFCAILLFSLVIASASAQPPGLIDSLSRNLVHFSPRDRAYALYQLVTYYQRSDQAKTKVYRDQARVYLKDTDLRVKTYAQVIEGIFYTGVGSLDSSEYWFKQAKQTAREGNDLKTLAIICSNLGKTLVAEGKAEEAVSNLMEGLRIMNQEPDREMEMKLRINLIWAYLELKRYRDGITLGRQTLALMDSSLQWMALYVYNNVAVCYGAINRLDSASYFVNLAIRASEINHDYHSLANAHFILGTIYANAGRNDLAILEYEKAKPFREKVGNPFYIVSDLYTLAELYQKTGNYKKAVQIGLEAESVAKEHNLILKFENTYQVLAMSYESLHDYERAGKYYRLWASIKDSVYQHANAQAIADMETKYETEKKEQQIALQHLTIEAQSANIQRNYILLAAMGLVIALVTVILFLIRSRMKRKQEVLKKEYEMTLREALVSASIHSQENERKRFARDLHDGLGQLISGLRFMVVKKKPVAAEAPRDEQLGKAEEILDEMHQEIRRVAFNLMPQMLIKGGLLPALQEMATRIDSTGQVRIAIQSFDLVDRLPEFHEVSLYRVVQEWINNVLKYARASHIQIQLVVHEDETLLTIEDDGAGFDRKSLEDSQGNGWRNIQARLNLIGATWELDTQPGRKGTTFIISIPKKAGVKP